MHAHHYFFYTTITHINDNLLRTHLQDPHTCTQKNTYIELLENFPFANPLNISLFRRILSYYVVSYNKLAHCLYACCNINYNNTYQTDLKYILCFPDKRLNKFFIENILFIVINLWYTALLSSVIIFQLSIKWTNNDGNELYKSSDKVPT